MYFQCTGFSLPWLLLLRSVGPRRAGFSCCGSQALEHRLDRCSSWAQLLLLVGSSQIRNQTPVSCIDRRILYQWATGESPNDFLLFLVSDSYFCFFMGHIHDFKFINLKFMSSSIHFSQCLNSIHLPLPQFPLAVSSTGSPVSSCSLKGVHCHSSLWIWLLLHQSLGFYFFLLLLMVSLSLSSLVS